MPSEVADDMAAIFGEGQREVDEASRRAARHVGARQGKRSRSRPMIVTLLSVAGFAAMIGTGVVVGKNTVGAANVGPSRPKTIAARPAPMPASRSEGRTLAPMALPPEAMSDPMVASATPADLPATATATATTIAERPVQANTASAPPRFESRNTRGDDERADVSFRRTPRVIQDQPANPPAAIAAGSRAECYGDTDCTLYAADGDVARAYAEATSSGVRARDLRDYRSEWIRARNVAADRPREALRIYDMVAADLRTLADDAVADDRTPWQ
jgi:hypothetical protein